MKPNFSFIFRFNNVSTHAGIKIEPLPLKIRPPFRDPRGFETKNKYEIPNGISAYSSFEHWAKVSKRSYSQRFRISEPQASGKSQKK